MIAFNSINPVRSMKFFKGQNVLQPYFSFPVHNIACDSNKIGLELIGSFYYFNQARSIQKSAGMNIRKLGNRKTVKGIRKPFDLNVKLINRRLRQGSVTAQCRQNFGFN